jgi:hypothetical protein
MPALRLILCVVGCGIGDGADVTRNRPGGGIDHDPTLPDGGGDLRGADFAGLDLARADLAGAGIDLAGAGVDLAGTGVDLAGGSADLARVADLARATDLAGGDLALSSVITGGPCVSGAVGATALRVRWVDGGGTAVPQIEAFGLPDHSREKVGAFGFNIGFTPTFDDKFLAEGGLVVDSSDFVDIELSTAGVAAIRSATLSIRGRSFNTSASGSFNWQSFTGTGSTPDNAMSNSVPYQFVGGDLAGALAPGDTGVLLRIKAGPSSDSLIVNQIEVCVDAG